MATKKACIDDIPTSFCDDYFQNKLVNGYLKS